MDLRNAGMDGFAATRLSGVRGSSRAAAHASIIALTANAITGDRRALLRQGMDDYLSKLSSEATRRARSSGSVVTLAGRLNRDIDRVGTQPAAR
jgi:CheY-like chemotaxis protein